MTNSLLLKMAQWNSRFTYIKDGDYPYKSPFSHGFPMVFPWFSHGFPIKDGDFPGRVWSPPRHQILQIPPFGLAHLPPGMVVQVALATRGVVGQSPGKEYHTYRWAAEQKNVSLT